MTGEGPCESLALWGPRRIGKTSILKCASSAANLEDNTRLTPIVLYQDCGVWETRSTDDVIDLLGDKVWSWLGPGSGGVVARSPVDRLEKGLDSLAEHDVRLTVIFDEIGRAAKNPRLGESFFSYLRGLTAQWDLQYLTASPFPLQDYWAGLPAADSTFFGLFSTRYVGPLTAADSLLMLRRGTASVSDADLLTLADACARLPIALAHAGDLLWRDSSLGVQAAAANVLGRPEVRAILRQMSQWRQSVAVRLPGFADDLELPPEAYTAVPKELEASWHRIEKATARQLMEAEALLALIQGGQKALSNDTASFTYGKALELQVRHSIIAGLSEFLDRLPDSLGSMGIALKKLSKATAPDGVRPDGPQGVARYLAERGATRPQLERFGQRLLDAGTSFRNPGAHDISILSVDDLLDARASVLGSDLTEGLLAQAIALHWGREPDGRFR